MSSRKPIANRRDRAGNCEPATYEVRSPKGRVVCAFDQLDHAKAFVTGEQAWTDAGVAQIRSGLSVWRVRTIQEQVQ